MKWQIRNKEDTEKLALWLLFVLMSATKINHEIDFNSLKKPVAHSGFSLEEGGGAEHVQSVERNSCKTG